MTFRNIHFITSTNESYDSIKDHIAKSLKDSGINWQLDVLKSSDNSDNWINDSLDHVDLIIAHGGDGTVTKVARAMIGHGVPLAILPSGTANVIAKELNIPINVDEAIDLILGEHEVKSIDTGLCNGNAFLIRVNFGWLANMVGHTDRALKDVFGQFAYAITGLDELTDLIPLKYEIQIDGKVYSHKGVFLTITNMGSTGIGNFSLLPNITTNDGLLDLILLDHTDLISMVRVVGSTLLQTDSEVLKRWKGKEIIIKTKKSHQFMCDDSIFEAKKIKITIVPNSLRVLIPKPNRE